MTVRRQHERGFALLLVFAMAAAAAILIYLELPRVGFEHQRNKEGLLAERGEQYTRAIQLYVKKFNKYPQSLDDLESTQNMRFLRRRYKDPMTNSDEWRLIHIDNMGQFTDSLVHKRADQKKESGPSVLSSNIVGIGESAQYLPQAGDKSAAALTRRASDRLIPGMPGAPSSAGQSDSDQPQSGEPNAEPRSGEPAQPNAVPPPPGSATTVQVGQSPFQPPVAPQPGIRNPTFPTQGVNTQQGGMMGQPIGQNPQQSQQGQPTFGFGSGSTFNPGPGGTAAGNQPRAPQMGGSMGIGGGMNPGSSSGSGAFNSSFGSSGFAQSGLGGRPGPTQNQAVQAIQSMLTTPRPGGAPGGMGGQMPGGGIQGGIAGVASKLDMEGIRVYNERSNYKEWEFLFDQKKALEAAGLGGQPGQQGGMMGQPGQPGRPGMMGQGGPNQPSTSGFSFGSSGSSSSSGSSGFGFGSSSGSSSGGFGFGSGSGSSGGSSQPKPAPGKLGGGR